MAKITDFGLSKFLTPEDTSLMTSNVGTAAFMAPEFWNKGKLLNVVYEVYYFSNSGTTGIRNI